MNLPDFLTRTADGEIRLAGHRIGLYHLIERYNDGDSAEMIASRFVTAPLALVHRVIAFYLEHRGEIDAYMAACSSALVEQRAAAAPLDLIALRDRLSTLPHRSAAPTPQAG